LQDKESNPASRPSKAKASLPGKEDEQLGPREISNRCWGEREVAAARGRQI